MKATSMAMPIRSTLTTTEQRSNTVGYSVVFIVLGLSSAVVGPTLPMLADQIGVGLSAISVLFTASALGGLIGSVAGGWLYDRVPGHPLLTAMLGGVVAGFFVIPAIPSLWLLVSLFLLLGLAQSIVDLGGNTLLVWVHHDRVGPFMNALHFFFGAGAFLAPRLVGWLMTQGGQVTRVYPLIALLIAPVVVGFLFLPSPPHPQQAAAKTAGQSRIDWLLVGGVAVFFFLYSGSEAAVGGWLYTYAVKQNLTTPAQAAYLTSMFWAALTLGRLASIPLAARLRPAILLFGSLAGCALNLTLIRIFPHHAPLLWGAACGLGVSMAAVFPTTLAFSERRMVITGQVTSVFFVGASLGIMSIPWGIGQLIEWRGPAGMISMLLACILASGLVMTGICLKARPRKI